LHNLISDPAQAARVRQLGEQLQQLMQQHHAWPDRPPLDAGIQNVLPKF
jgi:hypothetical protein